jgi:two-component system NtrC family sensor kinase
VVEIEDDGRGMPEAVRRRVFEPFFTTKEPGKGTGLGLATSHNVVVKQHGGSIDVETRPGYTRFVVRLPIVLPNLSDGNSRSSEPQSDSADETA